MAQVTIKNNKAAVGRVLVPAALALSAFLAYQGSIFVSSKYSEMTSSPP